MNINTALLFVSKWLKLQIQSVPIFTPEEINRIYDAIDTLSIAAGRILEFLELHQD